MFSRTPKTSKSRTYAIDSSEPISKITTIYDLNSSKALYCKFLFVLITYCVSDQDETICWEALQFDSFEASVKIGFAFKCKLENEKKMQFRKLRKPSCHFNGCNSKMHRCFKLYNAHTHTHSYTHMHTQTHKNTHTQAHRHILTHLLTHIH